WEVEKFRVEKEVFTILFFISVPLDPSQFIKPKPGPIINTFLPLHAVTITRFRNDRTTITTTLDRAKLYVQHLSLSPALLNFPWFQDLKGTPYPPNTDYSALVKQCSDNIP